MKQTAVNYLIEQITSLDMSNISDEQWFGIIGEAREMERQQIIDAVDGFPIEHRNLDGAEYYTQTFTEPKND